MRRIILAVLLLSCLVLTACETQYITITQISTTTARTTTTVTITTTPALPSSAYIITKNISYIITKKTENYWYFSWQATIKNQSYTNITLYVEVDFVNRNGFMLDYTNDIVTISPGVEKTILGEEMMETDLATNVVSAVLSITQM